MTETTLPCNETTKNSLTKNKMGSYLRIGKSKLTMFSVECRRVETRTFNAALCPEGLCYSSQTIVVKVLQVFCMIIFHIILDILYKVSIFLFIFDFERGATLCISSATSRNLTGMLVGRILVGIGLGIGPPVASLYVTEVQTPSVHVHLALLCKADLGLSSGIFIYALISFLSSRYHLHM